jgi:hypothetical protein
MKRALVIIALVTISFAASAQWYRVDLLLKKKPAPYRPPLIEKASSDSVTYQSIARLPQAEKPGHPAIYPVYFARSEYSYEAAEDIEMKAAQHNMRFRVYNDASYNFSELARLYILQNKFSEAKWYLLQSNNISREQNDNKHTIENLIDLAMIKTDIGDYALAEEDLSEAYNLACVNKFNDYLAEIEKKELDIAQNKLTPSKLVSRYSDELPNTSTAE